MFSESNKKNWEKSEFNSKSEWLSLSKLSVGTSYSAEYLSLLARRRKLVARKVDNVWHSTREALREYTNKVGSQNASLRVQEEFIPLSQLALGTPYSAEYLSLLARRRKLSAIKINGAWCATKEALNEYSKKQIQRIAPAVIPESQKIYLQNFFGREEKVLLRKIEIPSEFQRVFRIYSDVASEAIAYVEKISGPLVFKRVLLTSLSLVGVMIIGSTFYAGLVGRSLSSDLNNRVASVADSLPAVTSVSGFMDYLPLGFENLKEVVWARFFPKKVANDLPSYKPTAPETVLVKESIPVVAPVVQTAIKEATVPYSLTALRTDLKTELESYIRSRLSDVESPLNYYANFSTTVRNEILSADTRPTVTRQSTSDVTALASLIGRLTDNGTFNNPTISGGSISATSGSFSDLTFVNATGTNATTTNLFVSNNLTVESLGGFGGRCLQVDNNGLVTIAAGACGSGSGGGSWSTTTSQVSGQFINYSNNNSDIVTIGGVATTSAPIYFDPNLSRAKIFNQYFDLSSSTLQNFTFLNSTGTSATTTNFATTNFCLNGDCRTTFPAALTFTFPFRTLGTGENSTSTTLNFGNGFISSASSTLTNFIAQNATTTNATSTNFATTNFCLNSDCRSAFPAALTFAYPFRTLGTGENSTSTTLNFGNGFVSNASSTLTTFTFTNATGTAATTTDLYVSNLASTSEMRANTGVIGSLISTLGTFTNALFNSSTTFQNFTAQNSTTTSATTTNLAVSGLASTTNLRANTANLSSLFSSVVTISNALTISSFGGSGTRCLQTDNSGVISFTADACGSASGGNNGGTWATTTSQVLGQFINYSLNNSDIVTIGGVATTSAPIYFDPNLSRAKIFNQYFDLSSSTLQNFTFQNATGTNATSTNLFVSGLASTTNLRANTATIGNLTVTSCSGCLSGGAGFPFTTLSSGENATSTTIAFLNGFLSTASSTLTNFTFLNATGTAATTTDLFVSGLASTTNLRANIANLGILTAQTLFVNSSSTLQDFSFQTATGTTKLYVTGDTVSTDTLVLGNATGANFVSGLSLRDSNQDWRIAKNSSDDLVFIDNGVIASTVLTLNGSSGLVTVGSGGLQSSTILATGSTTLQNFTAQNGTTTNATTTNSYFSNSFTGPGNFTINSNGSVGIGTTTANQKLSVAGDILGNHIIGSYFTATSTIATSTFAGGILGANSLFKVEQSSGNTFLGSGQTDGGTGARLSVATGIYTPGFALASGGFRLSTSNRIEGSTMGSDVAVQLTNGFLQLANGGGGLTYASTNGVKVINSAGVMGKLETDTLTVGYATGTAAPATGALFAGKVGIGSTTPLAKLSVHGLGTDSGSYLFIISSSTAAFATTTHFSVRSDGLTTMLNATTTDLKANTATIGNLTVTSCSGCLSGGAGFPFTTLSSGENATSTTIAFLNGFLSTASSTLTNFTFLNATGTAATTTDLFVSGLASTTNLRANVANLGALVSGNLLVNGSTSLQSFTAINSTTTNATSTNLHVSGLASTTALRSNSGSFGVLESGDIVSKGITWTNRSAAGNNDTWTALTYGNNLFVAVSASGDRVMTSPDGVNWTTVSAAGDDDSWNGVTYGNGLFVAVGELGDRVMTSPDGVNWTVRSAAGNNDSWSKVSYGNGLFVAVGFSGDRLMVSPDGINWTARSVAEDDDTWGGVTYGNGLFVAVGQTGDDRVITSPDGITWTVRTAAGDNDYWNSVTYGHGLFAAVGEGSDYVMTSPDGITWTARSAAGNNDTWKSVTYGSGVFVAVGTASPVFDEVMTSVDGINWVVREKYVTDDQWNSVAYGNGTFVTVGGTSGGTSPVMTSGRTEYNALPFANIFQNSTTTSATTTDLFVSGLASTTNLRANIANLSSLISGGLLVNGSTTLQNFTAASSTIGILLANRATTTDLFVSNLASTTNLRANVADIGLLNVTSCIGCGSSTFAFPFTKLATNELSTSTTLVFASGFISGASSTLTNFTADNSTTTNATSTNLFVSGLASTTNLRVTTALIGDGTASVPALAYQRDPDTGFYSSGVNQVGITTGGILTGLFTGGSLLMSDGTIALPAFGFYNDIDTGIYRHAADTIGFSSGSSLAAIFTTASSTLMGDLTINGNSTTTNATTTNLFVSGLASTTNLRATTGLFGNGTVSSPSISFQNDSDTGFYSSGANQVGIVTGGALNGLFLGSSLFMSDATALLPAFSFYNDTDTGLFRNSDNVLAISSGGTVAGLFTTASSTLMGDLHISGNSTTTNATTTNLFVSGLASTTLLRANVLLSNILTTPTVATDLIISTRDNAVGASGGVSIDSGNGSSDGAVNIGPTRTSAVNLGRTAITTTNNGAFLVLGSSTLQTFTAASSTIGIFLTNRATTTSLFVSGLASTSALRVGGSALFGGPVGIGTTSPIANLDIFKLNGDAAQGFTASSTVGVHLAWTIGTDLSDSGKFKISSSTLLGLNDRLVIDGSGNVGIGVASPGQQLTVGNGVALWGLANDAGTAYLCTTLATGVVSTSTTACNPSSLKYKENIEDISYGLAEVLQLHAISYDYKKELLVPGHQVGFIAEEVYKIIPEVVGLKDGAPDNLDYAKLTALLTKAIQEIANITGVFRDNLIAWLGDAENGIEDFFANRVHTKELCVGDSSGETCITKAQLDSLLAGASVSGTPSNNDTGTSTVFTPITIEEVNEENATSTSPISEDSEENSATTTTAIVEEVNEENATSTPTISEDSEENSATTTTAIVEEELNSESETQIETTTPETTEEVVAIETQTQP